MTETEFNFGEEDKLRDPTATSKCLLFVCCHFKIAFIL